MKKIVLLMLLGVVLTAVPARADVSYAPFMFGGALDEEGEPITDGTYTMILDIDGDGWDGNPYLAQSTAHNATSYLWDTDDILLDYGSIEDGSAYPIRYMKGDPTTDIPGYDAGVDPYYLFWFDTPFIERGDFDFDSDADGNDFLAWQRAFGDAEPNDPADTDGDGDVDGDDFLVWQRDFGTSFGPGGGVHYGGELLGTAADNGQSLTPFAAGGNAGFVTVAPEPVSASLFLMGAGLLTLRGRFRQAK